MPVISFSARPTVKAVQTVLGHKSAQMALHEYSEMFPDDLDAVAAKRDEAVRAQGVGFSCGVHSEPTGKPEAGPGLRPVKIGVELRGIEPRTSSMRTKRATNCATAPWPADPSPSRQQG